MSRVPLKAGICPGPLVIDFEHALIVFRRQAQVLIVQHESRTCGHGCSEQDAVPFVVEHERQRGLHQAGDVVLAEIGPRGAAAGKEGGVPCEERGAARSSRSSLNVDNAA